MQVVEITHSVDERLYCPFCGNMTLGKDTPFDPSNAACPHLLYVAVTEGGIVFESPEVKDLLANYKESQEEDDLIEVDIEDGIHFSLCSPAPSGFGTFVGYKK